MFTWICPKCGREVPPAYTECPNCEGKTAPAGSGQPAGPPVAVPIPPASEPSPAPTETRRRPVWSTGVAEPPRAAAPPHPAPPLPAAPTAWSTGPAAPPPPAGAPNEPAYTPQFGAVVGPPPKQRKMPTWLLSL